MENVPYAVYSCGIVGCYCLGTARDIRAFTYDLVLHTVGDTTASTPSVDRKDPRSRVSVQKYTGAITYYSSSPFVSSTTTVSGAIGTALALRPKGSLLTLDMSRRDYNRWFSQYRDGINAYRQTLQSDPHFKTVSVPVGDWPVPGRTIFGYSNGEF